MTVWMSWRRWSSTGCCCNRLVGRLPNVAELIAGEPIKGSWWGHPQGHAIFNELQLLDESPDVVRLRLVGGKVTLVHRRLWPALVRVADRFAPKQLAALHEEHTPSGAHRVVEQPFPEWVPADVMRRCQARSRSTKHSPNSQPVSGLSP